MPIASPAVIEKIGNRFRRDVDAYAKANDIPVLPRRLRPPLTDSRPAFDGRCQVRGSSS